MIVADTGALIAVALIGLLPFARRLLGDVLVPQAVIQECVADTTKPAASIIREALDLGWLVPAEVQSTELAEELSNLLDEGEAQAIALALALTAPVLIDERLGRRVAQRHGLAVVGSLAVALQAKQSGLVSAVSPLIQRLEQHGYYLSEPLKKAVLTKAGED